MTQAALDRGFFARDTATVATALIGHRIVAPAPDGGTVAVRIVETEAYLGPEDPGSHATRGPDTQAHRLWGTPGLAYVYICYGIHQMLNVAAHPDDGVGAVLFRAGEPVEGLEAMQARRGEKAQDEIASGPGNLAEALGVTRAEHDGIDLTTPEGVHLAEGTPPAQADIAVTGRIGLSQGSDRLLRFVDTTSPALSRPVAASPP